MKVRYGFVSNSSSSSFIVKCKGELTVDFCYNLLMDTWGYLNLESVDMKALAQKLYDQMSEYTGYPEDKWSWLPISPDEVKRYKDQGYNLYEVWLSDHSGDSNGICLPDEITDKLPSAGNGILECDWAWAGNRPFEVIEYENQH